MLHATPILKYAIIFLDYLSWEHVRSGFFTIKLIVGLCHYAELKILKFYQIHKNYIVTNLSCCMYENILTANFTEKIFYKVYETVKSERHSLVFSLKQIKTIFIFLNFNLRFYTKHPVCSVLKYVLKLDNYNWFVVSYTKDNIFIFKGTMYLAAQECTIFTECWILFKLED